MKANFIRAFNYTVAECYLAHLLHSLWLGIIEDVLKADTQIRSRIE